VKSLNIQFNYMMLFLRTDTGMDVLLPADGHRATLTQDGVRTVALPPGSRVWIEIGGQPSEGPVTVDRRNHGAGGREAIVNARQLFRQYGQEKRFVKKACRRDQSVPAMLNARVELNGGHLEAATCVCPHGAKWARAEWRFKRKNFWNQPLTDRALFQMPLADIDACRLKVLFADGTRDTFDPTQGTHFIVSNGDLPQQGAFTGVLTEFQALYDLYEPPLTDLDYPELNLDSVPAWARPLITMDTLAALTPEVPLCPPLEDCEEGGGDEDECEKP
jgi:hypothetical protein